tara:strand:+ start:1223 stop:1939 length:717 start_codon:yes stop_codon:yes gene_type:complete
MALPKLETPKHSCILPVNGQEVIFRPFLVGEQKLLLIAQESENEQDISREVLRLIDICTDNIDTKDLATVDIEWLFLQLRIKSVGETSDVRLQCQDENCEKNIECEIDLESAQVVKSEKEVNPIINLTPTVGMELQYPSYKMMQSLKMVDGEIPTSEMFNIISKCVVSIIDGDEVLGRDDFTENELMSFIDSMSTVMFVQIQEYLDTAPKIVIEHDYKCSACEKDNNLKLEGIGNFFG